MDDQKNYSRVNKYDKRGKTTKSITTLMIVAIALVIILIAVLVFGGRDEEDQPVESSIDATGEQDVEEDEASDDGQQDTNNSDLPDEQPDVDEEETEEFIEIEEIPKSDIEDPNVIEAYTANWRPIGTIQEEPHETVFDQESDDWREMIEAISYALKLDPDELLIHWIGNGGEQRVNGHVQSTVTSEHYTVYLQWVTNEGWQPFKVERVDRFIHPKQAAPEEPNDENNSNQD